MSDVEINSSGGVLVLMLLTALPGIVLSIPGLILAFYSFLTKKNLCDPRKTALISVILIWIDGIGLYLMANVDGLHGWLLPQNNGLIFPVILARLSIEIVLSLLIFRFVEKLAELRNRT
ncbi:hypothetical protein [Thalassospira sp.]|uniref:hypothetical protein n=1 Tax=Thalassospira sp. TaxID=1912094 RepID=UPI003AA904C2